MKIRLLKKSKASEKLTIEPLCLTVKSRPRRVLDFDIENRPLAYLGSDFTTAEVTAIAWAWIDKPEHVKVYLLGVTPLETIIDRFLEAYNAADVVTGHFITGHDLPMINGACMELGKPPLNDKMVQDTKTGLVRAKGISKSQESLGAMLGLEHDKVQMNQTKWRAANRLTPEGIELVRERVTGDVQQHIEMRRRLLDLGYLGAPVLWKSGGQNLPGYTA